MIQGIFDLFVLTGIRLIFSWFPAVTIPAFLSCPSDPCLRATDDLDCCSICHEGYFQQHKVLVTPCNHRYHEACITEWLKPRDIKERTCALCRRIAVPLARESSSPFDDDKETNPFVESPILRSVRLGRRDFITPLLASNPVIANQRFLSAVSGKKVSLLYIAAHNGHRELAADLLIAGADPEKRKRIFGPLIKKSAIQAARQNHHDDIAQMLTDWIRDTRGG